MDAADSEVVGASLDRADALERILEFLQQT